MNLNQLRCFCRLAKNQHYSRTAEQLSMAQSSLSRIIAQLEEELGAALFERRGRNIVLTRQGKIFYKYVEKGIENIDLGVLAVQEMMDPGGGIVDFAFIYALSPFFVPRLVERFMSNKENKNINFRFYQENSRAILHGLREGNYDLGFTSYVENEPMIQFTPLVKQEYVLMVSKKHPLARKKMVTLEEAAQYEFILPLDKTDYLENLFRERGIEPRASSRVEEDHAAAALTAINLGISVIPRNEMLKSYGVELIPFAPEPLYRQFYMAIARKNIRTPAAEVFYKFILGEIKKNGGGSL